MITGNEPAYPMDFSHDGYKMNEGLTIRQQFSAMALQGLLANPAFFEIISDAGKADNCDELYAQVAIEHADALIAELNKATE